MTQQSLLFVFCYLCSYIYYQKLNKTLYTYHPFLIMYIFKIFIVLILNVFPTWSFLPIQLPYIISYFRKLYFEIFIPASHSYPSLPFLTYVLFWVLWWVCQKTVIISCNVLSCNLNKYRLLHFPEVLIFCILFQASLSYILLSAAECQRGWLRALLQGLGGVVEGASLRHKAEGSPEIKVT